MRKNWKRILAAALAACMIFGDVTPVYAAEVSETVVEDSETSAEDATEILSSEEDVVMEETTTEVQESEEQITESLLPEVDEIEDMDVTDEKTETPETSEKTELEDAEASEEAQNEATDSSVEENVESEETVILEEEIICSEEVTEVTEIIEMSTSSDLAYITAGETVTIPSTGTFYNDDFYYLFAPEKDSWYYLYADRSDEPQLLGVDWYDTETQETDQSVDIKHCYKFKDYDSVSANDWQECFYLEAGNTYQIHIYHNILADEDSEFVWKEKEDGDTATVLTLGDEKKTSTVTAGNAVMFKLTADTAATGIFTFTQATDGTGFYNVCITSNNNFKVPVSKEIADDESWMQQAFLLSATSEVYVAVSASAWGDATITWENISETLNLNQEVTAQAGVISSYKFTPEKNTTYKVAQPEGYTLYRVDNDGMIYNLYGTSSTDTNGLTWKTINTGENTTEIIIAGKSDAQATIAVKGEATEALTAWSGSVNVGAGDKVKVTYSGVKAKEFLIKLPAGVEKEDISVPAELCVKNDGYSISGNTYVGYELSPEVLLDDESVEISFRLENTGDEGQTVEFLTNESLGNVIIYTYDKNYITDEYYDADSESYFTYFEFTPYWTAVYELSERPVWGYCKNDGQLIQYQNTSRFEVLEDGKTYIFKFARDEYIDFEDYCIEIRDCDPWISKGDCFEFYVDDEPFYFTPNVSGFYSAKDKGEFCIWNSESRTWDYYENDETVELEADKTYILWGEEGTIFGLKRDITVLDFDYYDALIQSGGSVTIKEDGTVNIKKGTNKFSLVSVIMSFFGVEYWEDEEENEIYYSDSLDDAFEDGNKYWTSKEGSFITGNLYKLEQTEDSTTYKEIEAKDIQAGDIILVQYEPEYVWVDSMEVSVDSTNMTVGEEQQIQVTTKAATEKYSFETEEYNYNKNPEIIYKSSNPLVVSVDADGSLTAHKEGKATITIAADAKLKHQENISDTIIKKTITITVGNDYCITYMNVFGQEGYLTDDNPTVYSTTEATVLTEPAAYEGYEFVGWYSDAKLTKKVTSIAKGSKGDKTFYAKWKLKEYNIHYELNGGQFSGSYPTSFTMEDYVWLETPIRHGYEFAGWYRDSACEGEEEWDIGRGTRKDVTFYAKWKWNVRFSLKLNAEDNVVTYQYNPLDGEWKLDVPTFVIETDPAGILINEDYYWEDYNEETDEFDSYSLELTLYKIHENGSSEEINTYYNTLEIDSSDIAESGNYSLQGTYRHPGEAVRGLRSVYFSVEHEKREYPVNKNIEWTGISGNENCDQFKEIYSQLLEKIQPDEEKLFKDLGEELVENGTFIIKNSKNKVMEENDKLVSGTYTVVYQIGENTHFLDEATAELTLKYSSITSAGAEYTTIDNDTETDAEGRYAGTTIAFNVQNPENFYENLNTSPYTTGVRITPLLNTPWGVVAADELETLLMENGYEEYSIEVTAKETTSKSAPAILEIRDSSWEDYGVANTYVNVIGNEEGTGKRTVTLTTTIKNNGTAVAEINYTIKNFTVVSGGVNAVKDISLELTGAKCSETGTNSVKTYLIGKSDSAKIYTINWQATNYEEDDLLDAALSWKSSNSKLATVKASSDGTVIVTIPKNAQGSVEITATAQDVGKKSASLNIIIADTGMRLETTSLTINSCEEEATGTAYLYPNMMSAELNDKSIEDMIDSVGIYEKVKVGKAYEYQLSSIFETSYDVETGELVIECNKPQEKAKTYAVYVGVKQSISDETEYYPLKIKDTCKLPKNPTLKAVKSYEMAYNDDYAELQLTTYDFVDYNEDENGDFIPDIQTTDGQKFIVVECEEVDWTEDATIWNVKLDIAEGCEEEVEPAGKATSKKTKNVEFEIGYEEYSKKATVKADITVTKTTPKLSVYGENLYAPVFYPEAGIRYVDVVIPVTESLVRGYVDTYGEEYSAEAELTVAADGKAYLGDGALEIALTGSDQSRFEIVSASCKEWWDTIPVKKGYTEVEEAIRVTVKVLGDKNANLQFAVKSDNFADSKTVVTTGKLKISARKASAESISLREAESDFAAVVKTLTFNGALAGKESIVLTANVPDNLAGLDCNAQNRIWTGLIVEGADSNSKKMLNNNDILVDVEDTWVTITTTEDSFDYKNCKLKVTMTVEGYDGIEKTKTTTLTLNFKKSLTPMIKLTASGKMYRGINKYINMNGEAEYSADSILANAKITNMPVGAKITNIRYSDYADYKKYEAPSLDYFENGSFFITKKADAVLPLGKDTIDVVYCIKTVTGEVLNVKSSVAITVADNLNIKADANKINLYNSAVGEEYGKDVTFYDAKSDFGIKVLEITNADELEKAGIGFNLDEVSDAEIMGQETVRFYVDGSLARGAEKTYTVKAKVAVIDAYVWETDLEEYVEHTGTEKAVTFKIVLNK